MSLGKVKFEDGREVELVEILDDVIVIEKAGKDGEVKRYRLKKTSEMYESVADQVDALVKGGKKKASKPAEPEDDELDEDEEEVAAKPAKKTGSVKGSGKAKDDADDEEEAPKETKKGKKASKPVEPEDDEVEDDDDEEEEAPKAKKAVKAEKASKAPKEKAEDAYNWDEIDPYQEICANFLDEVSNPNEAAVYLFKAEGKELEAIVLLLNAERVLLANDNCNLSLLDIKRASVGVKNRAKETDYKKIYDLLGKLTDGDNSALIPEIVAATAEADEKSIFSLFDKDFTKKNLGFLGKAYKTLVEISDSIANKVL